MNSRTAILNLGLVLALLLVALPVLVGGYAIAAAAQDAVAAKVLWWVAMSALMLIVADFALLVGVLAVRELQRRDDEHHE